MGNSQKELCEKILEALIDGTIDDAGKAHLSNCKNCQQMNSTLAALATRQSVYDENDNLNLKKRVINRLSPIITTPAPPKTAHRSSSPSKWLIGISIGSAIALMMLLNQQPIPSKPNVTVAPPKFAAVDSHSFKISVNGKTTNTISMDSPVSLFNNENAVVTLDDHSQIEINGPARLTIKPRGFHLLAGKATATVEPSSTPFIATTVHGKIEVLGTIFTCETWPGATSVAVTKGKVKVTDNDGTEMVLVAGESTKLLADNDAASKTEDIPKISQE